MIKITKGVSAITGCGTLVSFDLEYASIGWHNREHKCRMFVPGKAMDRHAASAFFDQHMEAFLSEIAPDIRQGATAMVLDMSAISVNAGQSLDEPVEIQLLTSSGAYDAD